MVRLRALPPNSGICFQRLDLKDSPPIPALVSFLRENKRRIVLGRDKAEVEEVEHFMAAAAGLGVTNLLVELTNSEMPGGDGSSRLFVELLRQGQVVEQPVTRASYRLTKPIVLEKDNSSLIALPYSDGLMLSYRLDFGEKSSLRQSFSLFLTEESFIEELSNARTFCLTSEVEEVQKLGLDKGITEENSFMIDEMGDTFTPVQRRPTTLRYVDEPTRHKLLDLSGDLFLSGLALEAKVFATRSGHFLNTSMAKEISILVSQESSLINQEITV